MFLLAGVLQRLQHYDDGVSKYMAPPSLPENFKDLKAAKRGYAKYLYRCLSTIIMSPAQQNAMSSTTLPSMTAYTHSASAIRDSRIGMAQLSAEERRGVGEK